MPWLTGAGTGTRIARVVMEEEYSVMGARGARAYGGDAAGGSRGLERLGNGWRTKEEKGGIVVFVGKESGEAGGELWVSLS